MPPALLRPRPRIVMMEIKPSFDVPAFVQGVIGANSGRLSVPATSAEIDNEVARTQRTLSRDSHTRFQQTRYMNSLNRLQQCLKSHALPADLTPRERLALHALSQALSADDQVLIALSSALDTVTLPEAFPTGIALQHRLAS